MVGNWAEHKRLLTHTLKLQREQGVAHEVALTLTLSYLSDANRHLGLPEEGTQQAKEAAEILGKLGMTVQQAGFFIFIFKTASRVFDGPCFSIAR